MPFKPKKGSRMPELKSTKLCKFFQVGGCTRGKKCTFAHTVEELVAQPDLYKTVVCRDWKRGQCKDGESCRHAHGVEELRGVQIHCDAQENKKDTNSCRSTSDTTMAGSCTTPTTSTRPSFGSQDDDPWLDDEYTWDQTMENATRPSFGSQDDDPCLDDEYTCDQTMENAMDTQQHELQSKHYYGTAFDTQVTHEPPWLSNEHTTKQTAVEIIDQLVSKMLDKDDTNLHQREVTFQQVPQKFEQAVLQNLTREPVASGNPLQMVPVTLFVMMPINKLQAWQRQELAANLLQAQPLQYED